MKLHEIQKTETKLFDLYAEIVGDKHLYIKFTDEDGTTEDYLPLNDDTYWEFDNLCDEYVDFHCENNDDPTYWFSGKEDAKELNKFTRKLWKACKVRG